MENSISLGGQILLSEREYFPLWKLPNVASSVSCLLMSFDMMILVGFFNHSDLF